MPAAQVANIGFGHGAGLVGIRVPVRHGHHVHRRFASQKIHRRAATKPQLDAGQGAVLVNLVRHDAVRTNIVVIPQRVCGEGDVVRGRMNGAVFRTNNAPATLCLGRAHAVDHVRAQPAHPGTVGHLVETVLGRYRPYFHRFEQYFVAFINAHEIPDS